MSRIHRIHRFFEERCRSVIRRGQAQCPCQRPGILSKLMLTLVYSPIEFKLRRRIQAKQAALNRRKIPFFDMPLL